MTNETYSKLDKTADSLLEALTRPAIFIAFLCLILFTYLSRANPADPDLFARLAMGRLVFTSHAVPLHDPFAFTPKNEVWIDHEWATGVVFYALYSLVDEWGLTLFKFFAVGLTAYWVTRAHQLAHSAWELSPFVIMIPLIQCVYLWVTTVRSQLFTYLFLSYLFFAWESFNREQKKLPLALLPLIMLFWANAHGGFVVGLGLLGIFTLYTLISRGVSFALFPLVILLFSSLATFVNPYGPLTYWSYILNAISMKRAAIPEWLPLNPLSLEAIIPDTLTLLLLVGIFIHKRSVEIVSVVLLLLTSIYGFSKYRLYAIYMITIAVYGTPYLLSAWKKFAFIAPQFSLTLARSAALSCGGLALFCTASLGQTIFTGRLSSLDYSRYPVKALLWLREHRHGGNVLVNFDVASYALWILPDSFKISMDGRYEEVYPEKTVDVVADALNVYSPAHQHAIDSLHPDFILLSDSALFIQRTSPSWKTIYSDYEYALLEK